MPLNQYENNIIRNAEHAAGNDQNLSVAEMWLYPGAQQEKEFGQQIALEKLQYEQSIDYKRQMEEMRNAGINPNTAAEGISKASPSTSAPSVPSSPSVPTPSDFASALSNIASGVNLTADSIRTLKNLDLFRENLRSDCISKLTQSGVNYWNARSIAETLPLLKDNQRADFYLKLGNFQKVRQEYDNLKATHNNILAEYDAIIARKDLDISQTEYFDALEGKTKEETRWQQQVNDFFQLHGYHPDSPLDVSLRNSVVSDGQDAESIGQVVEDYHKRSKEGEQQAVEEHAYGIAYESGRAEYDFNWSAPPKTVTEFLWKSVGNMKEKLSKFSNRISFSKEGARSSAAPLDMNTIKNSWIEYKGQLSIQYERLNMLRAEYADKIASGANQKEVVDLKIEIGKLSKDLKSMPQTYNEFLKYLKIKP